MTILTMTILTNGLSTTSARIAAFAAELAAEKVAFRLHGSINSILGF